MSSATFVAGPEDAGGRLDAIAAAHTGLSRASIATLIGDGGVLVDGIRRPRSFRLTAGEHVDVQVPEQAPEGPAPESGIEVPVRFEDEWLMVVAKPAGLVVHPAPGHAGGTMVNALLGRDGPPAGGDALRPGIVHRLDAGTSGLMVVAKDVAAYGRLVDMMRDHEVERRYLALVEDVVAVDEGTVDAPIGRSLRNRKKMDIVAGGRDAVTDFSVRERLNVATLIDAWPRTGRTHQIRVHMAAAGHAVVGDEVYGKDRKVGRALGLARPFLHSAGLSFIHPMTAAPVALGEPLPSDLQSVLDDLRRRSGDSRG